jgi:hypothetical protein
MESEIQDEVDWDDVLIGDEDEVYVLEAFNSEGEQTGYTVVMGTCSTYFGPDADGPVRLPRGMFGKRGQLEKMGLMIVQGWSSHRIVREVGGSKNTVLKLRRVLEILTGKEFMCPCGKPVRHQGFCAWRIEQSPARQAYLAQFPQKSRRE